MGEQAGYRSGRDRLTENSLGGGEPAVGVEDLLIRYGRDAASRAGERSHRLLPTGGVTDPDRRGDRLRVRYRRASDQRRRPLGLEAVDDRSHAERFETTPVGGHVAGVANRDRQRAGCLAELLDHLKRRSLLPLDTEGVNRVDQLDR